MVRSRGEACENVRRTPAKPNKSEALDDSQTIVMMIIACTLNAGSSQCTTMMKGEIP